MNKLQIELFDTDNGESVPPKWASDETQGVVWYFQNALNEQWVAKLFDGKLHVTGMDISWAEFELDAAQVEILHRSMKDWFAEPSGTTITIPFEEIGVFVNDATTGQRSGKLRLQLSESYWLMSVLSAALPRLQIDSRKASGY